MRTPYAFAIPAYHAYMELLMRKTLLLLAPVVLLGGCTWGINPDPGSTNVRTVWTGDVSSCRDLGKITVSVQDHVGPFDRNDCKCRLATALSACMPTPSSRWLIRSTARSPGKPISAAIMCLSRMHRRRFKAILRNSRCSRHSRHRCRRRRHSKAVASSPTLPRAADFSLFAEDAMQIQLHGVLQLRQRGLTARHARFHVNGGGSLHHLLHHNRSGVHFLA